MNVHTCVVSIHVHVYFVTFSRGVVCLYILVLGKSLVLLFAHFLHVFSFSVLSYFHILL